MRKIACTLLIAFLCVVVLAGMHVAHLERRFELFKEYVVLTPDEFITRFNSGETPDGIQLSLPVPLEQPQYTDALHSYSISTSSPALCLTLYCTENEMQESVSFIKIEEYLASSTESGIMSELFYYLVELMYPSDKLKLKSVPHRFSLYDFVNSDTFSETSRPEERICYADVYCMNEPLTSGGTYAHRRVLVFAAGAHNEYEFERFYTPVQ